MNQPAESEPLDDSLRVLRRITDRELLTEENGQTRITSQAFIQGTPDGNVSVYLSSETTPERVTRNRPNTFLAELTIAAIRALDLDVQREQIDDDPGHCNIVGRKTRGKARAMAEQAQWIPGYTPDDTGSK